MSEELEVITKKLENDEERIARLEKLFQTKREEIEKKISIREFILSKNPKSEMDKALAVGYYFETYEGFTSFNVKDLENGFRRTKEKIPRNINYEVIRNIQKGFMMEAEEKKENRKAWYLTNSGMKYVENNFEQEK